MNLPTTPAPGIKTPTDELIEGLVLSKQMGPMTMVMATIEQVESALLDIERQRARAETAQFNAARAEEERARSDMACDHIDAAAKKMEPVLRARLLAVESKLDLANHLVQQLTAVFEAAGAPEFSSAFGAEEWAKSVKANAERLAAVEAERAVIARVMQTKRGIGGNCLAACLASVFEVSLESIPDLAPPEVFDDYSLQSKLMREWLAGMGFSYVEIDLRQGFSWTSGSVPNTPCLLAVESFTPEVAAKGFGHFVVGRVRQLSETEVNIEVLHDPNGRQEKYTATAVGFFVPLKAGALTAAEARCAALEADRFGPNEIEAALDDQMAQSVLRKLKERRAAIDAARQPDAQGGGR